MTMKKTIILLAGIFFLAMTVSGCAEFMEARRGTGTHKAPSYPTATTPEIKQAFQSAEDLYLANKLDAAKTAYEDFISGQGYNEYTDEARFKVGEILFMKGSFDDAVASYHSAYAKVYSQQIAPKSQFKEALSLTKLNRNEDAVGILNKIDREDASPVLRIRIDSLNAWTKNELKYPLSDVIGSYLFLIDDYADYTGDQKALKKTSERIVTLAEAKANIKVWIDDKTITTASVEKLPLKAMKGKASGGYAYYKLGTLYHAQGELKKAAKYLGDFVAGYPKNEYYADALPLYDQVKSYYTASSSGKSGKQYKVGVILPLSGKYERFGKNVLHGIECAAGLASPCTSNLNVQLVTRDSQASAEKAAEAVRELVEKEGVVAIIGDMMSSTVEDEARVAQEIGIPMISLSQREGVADIGDFIFRYAMDPESQAETLVDYTIKKRGIQEFGIMYPQNSYGHNFRDLFRTVAEGSGASVVGEKSYAPDIMVGGGPVQVKPEARVVQAETAGQPAPQPVVKQRSGVVDGLVEGHAATQMQAQQQQSGSMSQYYKPPEFKFPAGSAIFMPDSYRNVIKVLTHLSDKDKGTGRLLLGTNRWNNPDIAEVGSEMEGAVFVDGFYKNSANPNTQLFVQLFTQAFNMEPTILEAQAFDAMKLLIYAIKKGGARPAPIRDALLRIKNFPGATGTITMEKNGVADRNLFILMIKGGRIVEAAENFGTRTAMKKVVPKTESEALAATKYENQRPAEDSSALATRKEVSSGREKYEGTANQ